MKKQTAVEWLIENLVEYFPNEIGGIELLVKQAKVMEKQQIENAVSNAISKADMVDNRGYFNFDKWYNETYGN